MTACKFCDAEITWGKDSEGKPVPKNVDGSDHRNTCPKQISNKRSPVQPVKDGNQNPTTAIIGRLEGYDTATATFMKKDGRPHTYAITDTRRKKWESDGIRPAEREVWMEVTLDSNNFVQDSKEVPAPDWRYEVPKPGAKPEGFKPASTIERAEAAGFIVKVGPPDPTPIKPELKSPTFATRDLFTPKDRLIVAQTLVKAYTDLWINTNTPDTVTFEAARKQILAAIGEDIDKLMGIGGT